MPNSAWSVRSNFQAFRPWLLERHMPCSIKLERAKRLAGVGLELYIPRRKAIVNGWRTHTHRGI
jgi:hypothetical protein